MPALLPLPAWCLLSTWVFNDNSNDWSSTFYTLYKSITDTAKKNENSVLAKSVLNTHPSLPLAAIEVVLKDSTPTVIIPGNIGISLQHWHYDVFRGSFSRWWFGNTWVQFLPDKEGKMAALQIDGTEFGKTDR
ncbi:MAG TPA: hypothetical protein VK645_18330 [Chitinophagaceae bacterium]|nr:hypothetical protein [Chitinophagaceae bacterium]